MIVNINGRKASITGEANPVVAALTRALADNGAVLGDARQTADILVVVLPLLPDNAVRIDAELDELQARVAAMAAAGGGRVLVVMSATGITPMRRHPEFSRRSAAAASAVRGLAMRHGGTVAINGLAVGAIGEPAEAGDLAMLSHVPLARPGTIDEVVGVALFLLDPANSYTTGQVLAVDGGWSIGYGRNF